MDIPVPHDRGGRAGRGGLQGLSQGQDSTAFGGAQLVDIPVPRGGGLHRLRPGQVSSPSSSVNDAFTWGFSHFTPKEKKCQVGSALGVGTGRGVEPIHVALASATFWSTLHSEASRAAAGFQVSSTPGVVHDGCRDGFQLSTSPSSCVSQQWVSTEFSCISCSRCSLLERWCIISSCLRIWQFLILCLGVAGGILKWILREVFRFFVRNARFDKWIHVLQQNVALLDELLIIFTLTWTRILRCFFFVLTQNGEVCPVDTSSALKSGILCTICTCLAGCMLKGTG